MNLNFLEIDIRFRLAMLVTELAKYKSDLEKTSLINPLYLVRLYKFKSFKSKVKKYINTTEFYYLIYGLSYLYEININKVIRDDDLGYEFKSIIDDGHKYITIKTKMPNSKGDPYELVLISGPSFNTSISKDIDISINAYRTKFSYNYDVSIDHQDKNDLQRSISNLFRFIVEDLVEHRLYEISGGGINMNKNDQFIQNIIVNRWIKNVLDVQDSEIKFEKRILDKTIDRCFNDIFSILVNDDIEDGTKLIVPVTIDKDYICVTSYIDVSGRKHIVINTNNNLVVDVVYVDRLKLNTVIYGIDNVEAPFPKLVDDVLNYIVYGKDSDTIDYIRMMAAGLKDIHINNLRLDAL